MEAFMKKFIKIFSFFALVVGISAISANAQTATEVTANVPFDFSIGSKTYSSGEYKVKVTKTAAGGAILRILDSRGRNIQSVLADRAVDLNFAKSQMIFNRYGEQRFLSKILTPNSLVTIPRSRTERQIAAGPSKGGAAESVTVSIY